VALEQHDIRSDSRDAVEQQSAASADLARHRSGHGPRSQQSQAAAESMGARAKNATCIHRTTRLGMDFIAIAPCRRNQRIMPARKIGAPSTSKRKLTDIGLGSKLTDRW
jgi:hypothetical protein